MRNELKNKSLQSVNNNKMSFYETIIFIENIYTSFFNICYVELSILNSVYILWTYNLFFFNKIQNGLSI